ncbi:MAG: type II secretion system protein GspF [Rhodocyclaceae bacterium]|nr:MAG: type II secretion system protein GspF [Rhodocyclaceae bacterium]
MTTFSYQAVDAGGQRVSGVIDADSARNARAQLRERGCFPLRVDDAGAQLAKRRALFGHRIGSAELCLLTRQWATLLLSGLTMEQTLTALMEQTEREATRAVLAGVRGELLGGASLQAALDRYPRDFPSVYRASVAAGDRAGQLAKVMLQLAEHLESRDALRRKTLQALIYPALVTVVALAVVVGLMTYVVPAVVGAFQQGRQTLPWLTRMMIGLSWLVREWGWLACVLLAAGAWTLRRALQRKEFRQAWDARLLRLPLLGPYLRLLDATRFASTLAILAGSGVPLLAALDAAGRVLARIPLVAAVQDASVKVREGMPLSRALMQTRQFPPLLLHMIASGEATGQLDQQLERAAKLQQTDLENRTALFTTLAEPVLLLVMGGLVLLIVLAVMQPIIDINHLIR